MEHTTSRHDTWELAPDEQFKMTQVQRTSYSSLGPCDALITSIDAWTHNDRVSWSIYGFRLLKTGEPGKTKWTGYVTTATRTEMLSQIPDEIRAKLALDGFDFPRAKIDPKKAEDVADYQAAYPDLSGLI